MRMGLAGVGGIGRSLYRFKCMIRQGKPNLSLKNSPKSCLGSYLSVQGMTIGEVGRVHVYLLADTVDLLLLAKELLS